MKLIVKKDVVLEFTLPRFDYDEFAVEFGVRASHLDGKVSVIVKRAIPVGINILDREQAVTEALLKMRDAVIDAVTLLPTQDQLTETTA